MITPPVTLPSHATAESAVAEAQAHTDGKTRTVWFLPAAEGAAVRLPDRFVVRLGEKPPCAGAERVQVVRGRVK